MPPPPTGPTLSTERRAGTITSMDARDTGLESLVVPLQSELQKTHDVAQDLLTAARTAIDGAEKATTRIEALEFALSFWNTGGDEYETFPRHVGHPPPPPRQPLIQASGVSVNSLAFP